MQLYVSFRIGGITSQEETLSQISLCVGEVQAWMAHSHLKLNGSKTDILLFMLLLLMHLINTPSLRFLLQALQLYP